MDAVAERLQARGDEPEDIAKRLAIDSARAEEIRGFADYIVINDDLDEASTALTELLDELYKTEVKPGAAGALAGSR
jgi:guanylate kinase